jgi:hypothetical protein
MEGSTATRRQLATDGEKAKCHPAPHASRGEANHSANHVTTGLLQVGVGSRSECAARIQHQHEHGQCADASARIRQEQRS